MTTSVMLLKSPILIKTHVPIKMLLSYLYTLHHHQLSYDLHQIIPHKKPLPPKEPTMIRSGCLIEGARPIESYLCGKITLAGSIGHFS